MLAEGPAVQEQADARTLVPVPSPVRSGGKSLGFHGAALGVSQGEGVAERPESTCPLCPVLQAFGRG